MPLITLNMKSGLGAAAPNLQSWSVWQKPDKTKTPFKPGDQLAIR